ncbi:carboxypeptidase-like regulatory domain-containing protein [Planctomycetes bacterium K23_9]|uniref:MSCRAMM family protein n=1 Tax=Stieleria marina TaxID=1930275 RepID=UPI0011AAA9B5
MDKRSVFGLVLGFLSVLSPAPFLTQLRGQPAGNKGAAVFYEPITVIGSATNADGEPIEDATIYLASVRFRQQLLGETTTDAQGNYRFANVSLPVQQSDRRGSEDYGVFEVFGAAKGYSTTWRGQRWYYPDRRLGVGERDNPTEFVGGQPIRQDLIFRTPAKLSGRVIDEDGVPIAGTRVVLFNAQSVSVDGYDGEVEGDTYVGSEDFTALYLSRVIPADMRMRTTDREGRFAFDNARAETHYRMYVTPPGFAKRQVYAATSEPRNVAHLGRAILFDGMTIEFRKRQRSRITVLYDDTGKPAKNVFVNVSGDDAHQSETTDANGQIEVLLPPGEYKVGYRTEYGTPYYSRHAREGRIVHRISGDTNGNPLTIRLERVATLQITVLSDPTGRPLEGVDIWVKGGDYTGSYAWRSWKPPNISSVERPRTDADGQIQLFLLAGVYRIGAGDQFAPVRHQIDTKGSEVQLQAGQSQAITLKLKRRGAR